MISREDLVFATCYQLTQLTAGDWENSPPAVIGEIDRIKSIDEPGEISWDVNASENPLHLTMLEIEPESCRKARKLIELRVANECLRTIMKYSGSWETEDSDIIKKEIVSRIANYEKQTEEILAPVPNLCHITL